jgi:calcineurin-like phosphoesterase family protein
MSKVMFTSDLHLGHKNIGGFRHFCDSSEENTAVISEHWFSEVGSRDTIYILGDAAFNEQGLEDLKALPGNKILILGNHDTMKGHEYLSAVREVHGIVYRRWKMGPKVWLSHAPIHPDELRGRYNIHGHVHYNSIKDERYINVCCDYLLQETGSIFMTLPALRERLLG